MKSKLSFHQCRVSDWNWQQRSGSEVWKFNCVDRVNQWTRWTPHFSTTWTGLVLQLWLIGIRNILYLYERFEWRVCHNLFHGGLFTFLSCNLQLRLKNSLNWIQETKTKTCCCNRWGSSTEDSTWYLVFVVKFVDLADITINNKQFSIASSLIFNCESASGGLQQGEGPST